TGSNFFLTADGSFALSDGYGTIRDLGWGVGQQRGCPLALGSSLTHAEQRRFSGIRLARTAVRPQWVPATFARASWITPSARGPPLSDMSDVHADGSAASDLVM